MKKSETLPAFSSHDYKAPAIGPPTASRNDDRRPNASKVAIPRLHRPSEDAVSSKMNPPGDKNRVPHACEPCRHRKTKCSGERPVCQHCQDFKLACVYMDGKRDRTKRQLGSLASRVDEYERLLEELSLRAEGPDQELIRKALDKTSSSDDDDIQAAISPRGRRKVLEGAGENKVSARVGSTESLDRISEDFNRDENTRATGFHGKNSELTWVQRLKRQASHGSDDDDDYNQRPLDGRANAADQAHHSGDSLTPVNASSYHCDDKSISVQQQVDPFEIPTRPTANALFQSYLETIHPSFPIIGKNTFTQQYNAYFGNLEQRKPNLNWLAILNMIFAIGAKHCHMVQSGWASGPDEHLVYFTRARMLGFNAETILGHADLQKVQITGLISFYLMATNQINRSWAVSGIAIRHATTLGLNLRNESKDLSDASKEIRYRVWWALCSTEDILAVLTGRRTSLTETDSTAPLPLPIEEDSFLGSQVQSPQALQMFRRWSSEGSRQSDYAVPTPGSSNQSSKNKTTPGTSISPPASRLSSEDERQDTPPCNAFAFRYLIRLSTFTTAVLDRLYRPGAMSQTWAQVQASIAHLNSELEDWRQTLPSVFDFSKKQRDQQFVRQRMNLGLFYYSTSLIINRPCLCRIDRKIPNESAEAKDFNRKTAARCVNAARGMLDLLPNEPNALGLFKIAPWWCLVHYLVQSATALMLELAFRADHMPNEVDEIFDAAKKALEWLRSMSKEDEAARRASIMCNDLLRRVAQKVGKEPREASNHRSDGVNGIDGNDGMDDMDDMDGMNPVDGIQQMHHWQDPQMAAGFAQPPLNYTHDAAPPFQPQMFTNYDDIDHMNWSYDPMAATSAPAPFENVFASGPCIDGLGLGDNGQLGYFSNPDQRWFLGSGA